MMNLNIWTWDFEEVAFYVVSPALIPSCSHTLEKLIYFIEELYHHYTVIDSIGSGIKALNCNSKFIIHNTNK